MTEKGERGCELRGARLWREMAAGEVRGLGAALGEIPAASAGMTEMDAM